MIERETSETADVELEAILRKRMSIAIECELEALELIGLVDDEPELSEPQQDAEA